MQIDVVRGRLDAETEAGLLQFWERRAGFVGEAAQRRLTEVVCLVRCGEKIVGSSSVVPASLEPLAGRRFFSFRCLLGEGLEDRYRELIGATFDALDSLSEELRDGAEGLCAFVDANQRRRNPEAEWDEIPMVYAGYLIDGRQLRVAYFSDQFEARQTPRPEEGWHPDPGYEIAPLEALSTVSADDVVAAWVEAGVLTRELAEARVPELLLVATGPDKRVAGMCTGYLATDARLGAEFWHYRLFVREGHRNSSLGISLAEQACARLDQRYVAGEERRGIGIMFEVENEWLKSLSKGRWRPYRSGGRRDHPDEAWRRLEFFFVGENSRGAHVRVHYFPGAQAPEPPGQVQAVSPTRA